MAYKMKRGNSAVPFKKLGSSPVKQSDPLDLGLGDEAKKFDKAYKARKSMPKGFNMSGKDTWVKRSKEILKKGGKFLGGKTLGVLGMLQATSSKADQPNFPKGDTHYQDPKKKIDFTSGE